jgi:hypothetical protein
MKKLFLFGCILLCLLLAVVPAASAIGGDQGWIEIRCNVDGANVYFDGVEKVLSAGVHSRSRYTPQPLRTIPLLWKNPAIHPTAGDSQCRLPVQQKSFMPH